MTLNLFLKIHQPYLLKKFTIFDIGQGHESYFDTDTENLLNNEQLFEKAIEQTYRPTNKAILKLLNSNKDLRLTLSFSGIFLEQCLKYDPELLESFREIVETAQVEVLGETYYHSFAFFYSALEFRDQIEKHRALIEELFGVIPKVFRNSDLTYTPELGEEVQELGFSGIFAEHDTERFEIEDPDFVFEAESGFPILLNNSGASEEISDYLKDEINLEKIMKRLKKIKGEVVNIFLDYEEISSVSTDEQNRSDRFEKLVNAIQKEGYEFSSPEKIIETDTNDLTQLTWTQDSVGAISLPAGEVGNRPYNEMDDDQNSMHTDALEKIYELEQEIKASKDQDIIHSWRLLQASDLLDHIKTDAFSTAETDTEEHPYESPYEAFISFTNALEDLKHRVSELEKKQKRFLESFNLLEITAE